MAEIRGGFFFFLNDTWRMTLEIKFDFNTSNVTNFPN